MHRKIFLAVAIFAIAGCTSTPTFQTGDDAERSFDGLTMMDNTTMGAVWAREDIDITSFRKVMFERVAKRYGVVNKIVYVPNHPKSDEEIVELYANAITSKTKLLMLCLMINITGHILPIKKTVVLEYYER